MDVGNSRANWRNDPIPQHANESRPSAVASACDFRQRDMRDTATAPNSSMYPVTRQAKLRSAAQSLSRLKQRGVRRNREEITTNVPSRDEISLRRPA